MQHKNHQDNIFPKRFPRCELDGVSETSAVGNFIKVRRIECEEGKKYHDPKKKPCGQVHPVVDQHGYAQHDLKHDHDEADLQCVRNEIMKERSEVFCKNFE